MNFMTSTISRMYPTEFGD